MPRVKGTIMLPLVKGLRANVKDAREQLPPDLHRYLDERVIVSDWYPEADHLTLLRVLGRSMGIGPGGSYEPMGHVLAQFELGGVYRGSLHAGDVERTLRAFVKLWPQNHDTGTLEIGERKGGGYTFTLTDFALPSREICEIVTGYIVEGVRMTGAATPTVNHLRCRARGASQCIWELSLADTR